MEPRQQSTRPTSTEQAAKRARAEDAPDADDADGDTDHGGKERDEIEAGAAAADEDDGGAVAARACAHSIRECCCAMPESKHPAHA